MIGAFAFLAYVLIGSVTTIALFKEAVDDAPENFADFLLCAFLAILSGILWPFFGPAYLGWIIYRRRTA